MKKKLFYFKKKIKTPYFFLLFFIIFLSCFVLTFVLGTYVYLDLLNIKNDDFQLALKYTRTNNEKHRIKSIMNKFGFNDINYPSKKKAESNYRIIIVGDSFIYGDGIKDKFIWSHILEKKLKLINKNVEVLHWGIFGWSTLDQLNFLKKEFGKAKNIFDADLIIFGIIRNDLDVKKVPFNPVIDREIFFWNRIYQLFPKLFLRVEYLLESFHSTYPYFNKGYSAWLQNLFSKKNIKEYKKVLSELKKFLEFRGVKYFFVATPNSFNQDIEKQFYKIEHLLNSLKMPYINLYNVLADKVKNVPLIELRASLVDFHPSKMLTELYAYYVYNHLIENNFIKPLKVSE